MRIDLMTVFPEFFQVLDVSLVGKARQRGLIDIDVHDVRDWTTDVHRTVDDSPFGGGAGMVMKPDVWAAAIDDVRARHASASTDTSASTDMSAGAEISVPRCVLAIPTPAGEPLTQQRCYELAQSEHVIIACGRYEGIDARVAQYYDADPDVVVYEYSLGDYVLNGGEVAAVALIEAVGRLVPGMVGNPESLVEESHGVAGLLEYPVYTRPADFRGLEVPEVLTSGNHQAVARWRRDRALERTLARRPDMIARLTELDKKDCALLAQHGWLRPKKATGAVKKVTIRRAQASDVVALSELAAATFPDACPAEIPPEIVAHHVETKLNVATFDSWIADPGYVVLVAECDREFIGYSVAIIDPQLVTDDGAPDFEHVVYLSKFYIARPWRGSGLAPLLASKTLAAIGDEVAHPEETYVWVGTNEGNKRAIRAYKNAGFVRSGRRTYHVGDVNNTDVTLVRPLNLAE